MRGVGQLDEHFVRARRQAHHNHGFAAGVGPMPWCIVDGNMDMPDPRRHIEGARTEDRHDAQVLSAILDEDLALSELLGERRVDNQPGKRLILNRDQG
jgi:hypothetical protein